MSSACMCKDPFVGLSLGASCAGSSFALFMTIVDFLIRNFCEVSDICSRVTPRRVPDDVYDFVVIGGGVAGPVVAARLSENPNLKVLLIERGDDEPAGAEVPPLGKLFRKSAIDYNFLTEPQKSACLQNSGKRCKWPRGKVLGGTGVLNGMMYMRGLPSDYNSWSEAGNTGWSFRDVFPYFLKSEGNLEVGTHVNGRYHSAHGSLPIMRFPHHPKLAQDILLAAEELGYPVSNDLNGERKSGFAIAQTNNRYGVRVTTARAFLRPVRSRNNLHIMLNTTGSRVLLNDEKVVTGVELIYNDKTFTVSVRKEVILSSGAINSPQILLLSGIGPERLITPTGVKHVHELPGVGKNLQNHVSFSLKFELRENQTEPVLNYRTLMEYIRSRTGPLSSTGLGQTTGRVESRFSKSNTPDLQFFFGGYGPDCTDQEQQLNFPRESRKFSISPVVLQPEARGYILLKTNNAKDAPLIFHNYLTHEYDRKLLVEGIRIALRLVNSNALKVKYGAKLIHNSYGNCEKLQQYDSDEFWECAIQYATSPENHQAGSCKMGPISDPLSVVDPKLQVHGITGLRVMDASVMPRVVSGNTFATTVMIAERGSDFIKRKWNLAF